LLSDWILQTTALCRHYRRGPQTVRAVDGIDLEIGRGESLALVGASGSGKSTLLNLLGGLDTPTSGSIAFEGASLSGLSRRELAGYRARRVGMVFQSFNLLAHHTALRNVELALLFNDTPRRERHARAVEILERLGLADRMDHRPGDLSGGEQQRVAIARALVKRPDILFADEPTGNLDQDNAVQIGGILSALNAEGVTIILATHDMALAGRVARRIVRLDYGRLAANSSHGIPEGSSQ